jgi:hypothetical protein
MYHSLPIAFLSRMRGEKALNAPADKFTFKAWLVNGSISRLDPDSLRDFVVLARHKV